MKHAVACPRCLVTMHSDWPHRSATQLLIQSRPMQNVACLSKALRASAALRRAMKEIGEVEHFHHTSLLFCAGDENNGVFLVRSGRVCLQVPEAPHLDRIFSAGSVLGLPSTFIGKSYSLTAATVTDCDAIHVGKKEFLDLMSRHLDLCREATDVLSREVAFIFSALSKRSRAIRSKTSFKDLRGRQRSMKARSATYKNA